MNKQILNWLVLHDDEESECIHDIISSSEDSDDCSATESLLLNCFTQREKRICINNYLKVAESYSDRTFISRFRIERNLADKLAELFKNSQIFQDLIKLENSRCSISPQKHILTFLWFAGHQTSSFRDVADRFDLCLSSLFDVITRISNFLSSIGSFKPPSQEEKEKSSEYYWREKGFPHVVGCIDGSHIKIYKPCERPIDYCNRKDYYSIQIQGVCDENLIFFDMFIGYPGSVHDARVFRNSSFSTQITQMCENGYIILGDSAYPLLPSLMTPYRDNGHLTRNQKKFNKTLSSCRVSIEHAFGLLKQRFRQLYHLKLRGHKRQCTFIHACCVLHNMANKNDTEIFNLEDVTEDIQPDEADCGVPITGEAVAVRNRIVNEICE